MPHHAPHTAHAARLPSQEGSWAPASLAASWCAHAARPGMGLLVALLVGVIFVVDLLLPLGIAGGVPYVAPVLLTLWLPTRRYVLPTAIACTALTVMGLLLSSAGAPLWAVLPNRTLALLAVWTVALLVLARKRAEKALAESQARASAVLATTADGVLTLDAHGRVVSANPAAEYIFGCSAEELMQRSLGDLLGPSDHEHFACGTRSYLRALASGTAATREVVGQRCDETTFPLELVLVPLERPEGLQYTATLRDVSERRLHERHLLQSQEEERQAIGHDLHEELGQTLTGLSLMSRQLARRLEAQHPDEAREVADLASLLHEADGLALRLFHNLVPVDANGGLAAALRQLVRERADASNIRCTVEGDGALPPADELRTRQLYRIVHDLVHELLRRGCVHHLALRLDAEDGLALTFEGEALPTPDALAEVVQQLAYRARLVGAHLETSVHSDSELRVHCTL